MAIVVTPTKEKYSDSEVGWWIRGETKEVINEVNKRLQDDPSNGPMYTHLDLTIVDIDKSELPYRIGVRLYRNLYAGD
jgi:hypothetical protein